MSALDGGNVEVTLKGDKFTRAVFLEIEGVDKMFSNNYLDMLPGRTYKVVVESVMPVRELEKKLKIVSLADRSIPHSPLQ